ncbi:hypothetical protein [Luteolibacter soli]|uniref:Uncharacterized protein n=1 Tax=Luteolibacter soli TaxID=3135280 RepID=A0ABU9AV52_9BACT
MSFTTAFMTDAEPLPTWCAPILRTLTRAHPEQSVEEVAQAIREALVVQRAYHVATPIEDLARQLLEDRP